MLEWKDVAPLLTLFLGTVGAIFGYGLQERRRQKAEQDASSPPAVMSALSTGIEEKTKLDLIEAHLVSHGDILAELLAHARKDEKERERDDMMEAIVDRLRRDGVQLGPKEPLKPKPRS